MKKVTFYVIPYLVALFLSFTGCKKEKGHVSPEFVGMWENSLTTIEIKEDATGNYRLIAVSGGGAQAETASGIVKVEGNSLTIHKKKFNIDAFPTEVSINGNEHNTFMVLNGDTLFKNPFISDKCKNGFKDLDETNIDCGGRCKKCETCTDGIKNQDETGVDCGGVCSKCPTCSDGAMNQGEAGVDCGGPCEPCSTNACSLALGEVTNGYLFSGIVKGITGGGSLYAGGVVVEFYFPSQPYITSYHVTFYEKNFTTIPIGTTALYKTGPKGNFSSDNINKCSVEFNVDPQSYYAEDGSKVYVTRMDQNLFNLKFCNLKSPQSGSGSTTNIVYSINANFSI